MKGLIVKEDYPEIKRQLSNHFAKEFAKGNESNQRELSDYLQGVSKEIPRWVPELSETEKNEIGLIRGQLNTYFPLTLSKTGFKDYAFSKNSKLHYAVPARLCQPIEGSVLGRRKRR